MIGKKRQFVFVFCNARKKIYKKNQMNVVNPRMRANLVMIEETDI